MSGGLLSMKSIAYVASLLALASAAPGIAQTALPSFSEPSLSPDAATIAFVSGGDIWEVPASGGAAHLLVSDAATEGRPFYSPDGTRIAFTSTRDGGNANIYVLDLASARLTRITYGEVNEELDGWSPDGKFLYFASSANNIGRFTDVMRVPASGGTPVQVTRETFMPIFQAAAAPDGKRLAVLARGSMAAGQFWRNGSAHIDETELWLKDLSQDAGYTRIAAPAAKQAWPMWSPDGATITYMSDQDGHENLWQIPATGGEARRLTQFTDGRLLFPSMAANGQSLVFERDFRIWRYDVASGTAAPVEIGLRGTPAGPSTTNVPVDTFDAIAVAPDGKKIALVGHGELFGLPTKDGTTERLTATAAPESESGVVGRFEADALRRHARDRSPAVRIRFRRAQGNAPDVGRHRRGAGLRARRQVRGLHPQPHRPATGHPARGGRPGKRADALQRADRSRMDGFAPRSGRPTGSTWRSRAADARSFTNVHVVPTAGGAARPVSFLANGQLAGMAWSPDGKFILFSSGQRAEPQKMIRVDLQPHLPTYREDVFRKLFAPDSQPGAPEDAAPAPKRPDKAEAKGGAPAKTAPPKVTIAWEGLRQRATVLPLEMDAQSPQITSDGKTLVFLGAPGSTQNLYQYNLDELADEPPRPKQISSSARPKAGFGLAADGKTLWYLDGGKVMTTPLPDLAVKPLPARGEVAVDFDQEKQVVFDQVWSTLDTYFYDPRFHGVDWAAARTKWQPYIAGSRTPAELRRNINLMIGELDASHSGTGMPGAVENNRVGDIGVAFDRAAYEASGALVVRELVPLGPAAASGRIARGDRIVSVDGKPVTAQTNFDSLVERKVGKQVALGIRTGAGENRTVTLQPVGDDVVTGLRYRGWVEARRAMVDRLSGGRLGYVHIADMGDESLDQLTIDLDAANQSKAGVVVDVRNNNGGYVHGRVIDILSRSNFLSMTQRGMVRMPARQALGQRALGLPTVALANESTLSDGEDFMEGYRALGLGKLVGQDSAGWIIYTGGRQLIDGSTVRVPSLLIEGAKGDNMERNPRPVDVRVEQPLGDAVAGRDTQLEAAVRVLLEQIGG